MRNLIAVLLAALGTLLVLAGAAITVVKTVTPEPAVTTDPTALDGTVQARRARLLGWVRNLRPADRIIGWGVVLLVLAAISAGAIEFNLAASTGTPHTP